MDLKYTQQHKRNEDANMEFMVLIQAYWVWFTTVDKQQYLTEICWMNVAELTIS